MPSPFPGMDPFIEDPEIWPGFHAKLAVEVTGQLNPYLRPKYYADIEIQSLPHTIEVDIAQPIRPDVSVFEPLDTMAEGPFATSDVTVAVAPIVRSALPPRLHSVRVYRTKSSELVTAIELLSPTNKRPNSEGLSEYRRKRAAILASRVHLVEIDLLRAGVRPGDELAEPPLDTDYILLVNRAGFGRVSGIWPIMLNQALPVIPIPLLAPDPDIPLDLGAAIQAVYKLSGYDWRIDYYSSPPPPPLRPDMAQWVQRLLAEHTQADRS
jgi:hypothetical protein